MLEEFSASQRQGMSRSDHVIGVQAPSHDFRLDQNQMLHLDQGSSKHSVLIFLISTNHFKFFITDKHPIEVSHQHNHERITSFHCKLQQNTTPPAGAQKHASCVETLHSPWESLCNSKSHQIWPLPFQELHFIQPQGTNLQFTGPIQSKTTRPTLHQTLMRIGTGYNWTS